MEIFPNAIKPIQHIENKKKDIEILAKYDIPTDSTVFIYGGNLGRPQGIDFLMEVIAEFNKVDDACLIIVGDGTEYKKLEHFVQRKNLKNAKIFNRLPKEEYDQLMLNADVGLIFLDHRFTIPNFPSRLLTYLENAIPVLAATDTSTDLKNILKDSQSGFWCESGDLESFIGYAKQLSSDKDLRKEMGQNGRKYLEKYYDVTYTVEKLLRHL
ncbi:MAG: glycosyltransferase family 4 protein, partial [Atopostipes suicloacalis]|nr:glycosyltransferase family 4 protein [Atopostipes suicloacalis]